MERLELSRLAPYEPESYVYTNFTTCPLFFMIQAKNLSKREKKYIKTSKNALFKAKFKK